MPSRFVGRAAELELFGTLLQTATCAQPAALVLHGVGGIGKSALLSVAAKRAQLAGHPVLEVDLTSVEHRRGALRETITRELADEGTVMFLDGWQQPGALMTWLRQHWSTDLPGVALVVAAGRLAPPPDLPRTIGWHATVHAALLPPLSADEMREYLAPEALPEQVREQIVACSVGNPLALTALTHLAVTSPERLPERSIGDDPESARLVIDGIVEPVPGRRHRRALQVAAHARYTTEDLLASAVDGDVHELFEWLRRQPYISSSRWGLYPDELVRMVVDGDLRWRDRMAYSAMHRHLMAHLVARIQQPYSDGPTRFRDSLDAMYLNRSRLPVQFASAGQLEWGMLENATFRGFDPADEAAVLAIAARDESAVQVAALRASLGDDPERCTVFCDRDGAVFGFSLHVERGSVTDTALELVQAHTQEYGPPRPGERVGVLRIGGIRSRQAGLAVALGVGTTALHALNSAQNSWDFLVVPSPELWRDSLAYFDFHEVGTYDSAGQTFGVFGHDWRRLSVDKWLAKVVDQPWDAPLAEPTGVASRVVASEDEFVTAVRDALHNLHSDRRLALNPLVDSRIVRSGDPELTPERRLRALILGAAESLRDEDPGLYRILDRTYLRQNVPQQRVAETLGIPFSTYRRHRNRAVELVAQRLWRRERGAGAP